MRQAEIYERVTNQILADLKAGAAPWVKPWAVALPRNVVSSRTYSGANVLLLWGAAMEHGYQVPGWLTYKQATELGGHVRKGEHGQFVVYAGQVVTEDKTTGETSSYSFLKHYRVFNVEQCDGLPEHLTAKPAPRPEHERLAGAESFFDAIPARVEHGGPKASYSPSRDTIYIPDRMAFETAAHYYATRAHETIHWSGHKSRLDRDLSSRFGGHGYAAEELVAELGAAFTCAHLGLKAELRHAGYIGSWIKLLGDHSRAIFTAASKASAATDYLIDLSGRENALAA